MGTGALVLFYTAIGCVVALVIGRMYRGGLIIALLGGLAALIFSERLFVQVVSWGDPFFWEGTLRLVGLAAIPVLLAAWLGTRFRRKPVIGD